MSNPSGVGHHPGDPIPYQYSPFEKSGQIRLLDLKPHKGGLAAVECDLEVFDLDNAPPFTALSYTHIPPLPFLDRDQKLWDSIEPRLEVGGDQEVQIKTNLFSALIQLCELGKHGYYWIDAICINQTDIPEKTVQIQLMGTIYGVAEEVVVWLGPAYFDSQSILPLMDKILSKVEDLFRDNFKVLGEFSHSFLNPNIYHELGIETVQCQTWDDIWEFFDRKWFQRAWTLQETLLAKRLCIICGPTEISWEKISKLITYLRIARWESCLQGKYRDIHDRTGHNPIIVLNDTMKLRNDLLDVNNTARQKFLENIGGGTDNLAILLAYVDLLLDHIRGRKATDQRDLIYALYGIVSKLCHIGNIWNPLLSPDYTKSVQDVFTDNVRSIVSHSPSLLILSAIEDRSQRKLKCLPSWVPDFTVNGPFSRVKEHPGDLFQASDRSVAVILPAPNPKTMCLVGYWVDVVAEVAEPDIRGAIHSIFFEDALKLLLKIPKTYMNGQDRFEAFWRLLVHDAVDGVTPADHKIRGSLHDHLLLAYAYRLWQAYEEGETELEKILQYFKTLLRRVRDTPEAEAVVPSFEEISECVQVYIKMYHSQRDSTELGQGLDMTPAIVRSTEPLKPIDNRKANSLRYRAELKLNRWWARVFRTEGSMLGSGPMSTQAGDRIFILLGARMPFVLRPAQDDDCITSRYEIVGECYVHGIMRGEALRRGVPIKIDLQIV